MTREEYWYCLAQVQPVNVRKWHCLRQKLGEVALIFELKQELLAQLGGFTDKEIAAFLKMKQEAVKITDSYHRLQENGIGFVSIEHNAYPKRLRALGEDAPIGLFYKGRLPEDHIPSAAIIGARKCSVYGKEAARHLGKQLAQHGVQIISGMALGADAGGQWGALEAGGSSFAVLGNGVDICYPRENFSLYLRLPQQGGIISEYPNRTPGLDYHFPLRNRLISGLSDCVVIVEAKEKSGTAITVNYALDQGKEIFAVPGRLGDALSMGCNRLIQQGANIVTDETDILDFLKISPYENKKCKKSNEIGLAKRMKLVYSCIGLQPKHVDDISKETVLPIQEVMTDLLQLELQGYIFQPVKNYYSKRV